MGGCEGGDMAGCRAAVNVSRGWPAMNSTVTLSSFILPEPYWLPNTLLRDLPQNKCNRLCCHALLLQPMLMLLLLLLLGEWRVREGAAPPLGPLSKAMKVRGESGPAHRAPSAPWPPTLRPPL